MKAQTLCSVVTAAVICAAVPAPSLARQVATTFQELQTQIHAGQRLVVTDRNGVRVKGKLDVASDSLIGLQTDKGRRDFSPTQVLEIRKQADSVLNGTLLGAAFGTLIGLVVGRAVDSSRGEGTWLAPIITAVGAGGGTVAGLLGDAARPHADLVFKVPPSHANLRVLTLFTHGRIGIQAVLQF